MSGMETDWRCLCERVFGSQRRFFVRKREKHRMRGKSPVMGSIWALITVLQGCRIRSGSGIMDVR